MDEDILAHGGVNVAREEIGSPTQPFSSPGRPTFHKDIRGDIDTTSYNCSDVGGIKGGDDESTVSDESENNEDDSRDFTISEDANRNTDDNIHNTGMEGGDNKSTVTNESKMTTDATLIDCTCAIHSVTWDNADGQTIEVYNPRSKFNLDIYTNTLANTAIFILHSYIYLKTNRRRSNKQNIYLLIPPERIKAITTQTSPAARATASNTVIPQFYSLHFSLIQQPDFIGPQSDLPLSKGKTKAQLDLLQDLAIVTEFTIHLASSDTVTPNNALEVVAHKGGAVVIFLRGTLLFTLALGRDLLDQTTVKKLHGRTPGAIKILSGKQPVCPSLSLLAKGSSTPP
ncbi:uncharacterized protein Triagg1_3452 [Trichoderma aggressivum f. europaeum]|uniref:Uncharacterized protein n=1 Tax=Trichoderma aggressivum f. europaeum TaxID=173218 RepID=A0AAE1IF91_9HYPO|nr:hypothetical protein Triagg1_3452 [Trichoderma aggressivum f. europaeum]